MNLFSQLLDPPINLLPQDGEANYHGVVFSAAVSYTHLTLPTTPYV